VNANAVAVKIAKHFFIVFPPSPWLIPDILESPRRRCQTLGEGQSLGR